MKVLYIDCGMGAAGDMLTAALLELMPDKAAALEALNAIGIEGVRTTAETLTKCGINGTHVRVLVNEVEEDEHMHDHEHHHDHHHEHEYHHEHEHHHEHHSLHDIYHQIDTLRVPERVREHAKAVYAILASAESEVHGVPMKEIHFHEVGTKDALADIVAVCYLMNELQVERVMASPIHVGMGQVCCAHGILPVPAPATANILKGIPTYSDGRIQGELCTPTGAALLSYFVSEFGPQPVMATDRIGYGCGKKDFEKANMVRVMLGNTNEGADEILELRCNMDDCTPENLAFAMEELLAAGALDVYSIPVTTKKNRMGVLFTVMCKPADREKMLQLIFQHTTTIGVREYVANRHVLQRNMKMAKTPYGEVAVKEVTGYGVTRQKAEYEDLARLAREQGLSIEDIRKSVEL